MGLSARGHDVTVVSIRDADIPGVPVCVVGGGAPRGSIGALLAYLRLLLRGRTVMRRLEADVVHAHYATTHGAIAALRSPVPYVLTVWGSDVMSGDRPIRRPLRWVARFAVGRAVTVTASSETMANVVASFTTVRPEVVRFGVETSRFLGVGRPPAHPFTIGFLKRLHPRYGPDVLVEAFGRVAATLPEPRLVMAGDGPMRSDLERRADELGIADRVQFTGRVDPADVPAFLERIHVLVNPSRSESFGVVLLEAAAAGVATVATAVGGTAEAMIDGETGLLVPPESPEVLAEAIIRLAVDADMRVVLGEHGQEFAAVFEWDRCIDSMEQVLERAVT